MGATSLIILLIALFIGVILLFELKKTKHKITLVLILSFILFVYFSFTTVFKNQDLTIKSLSDVERLTNLYTSWLVHIFGNIKIITGQIVKMDWKGNVVNNSMNFTKITK